MLFCPILLCTMLVLAACDPGGDETYEYDSLESEVNITIFSSSCLFFSFLFLFPHLFHIVSCALLRRIELLLTHAADICYSLVHD